MGTRAWSLRALARGACFRVVRSVAVAGLAETGQFGRRCTSGCPLRDETGLTAEEQASWRRLAKQLSSTATR